MKAGSIRPAAWLGPRFDLDFVEARARPPALGWALLAGGVLALAAAAGVTYPAVKLHDRLLAQREALRQQLDRVPGGHAASHPATAVDLKETRLVLGALDRPWNALLDRFESVAVPRVHLVQVTVDGGFQAAQLTAEAARLDDVLRYARQLEHGGPVREVRLTRHEWRNAPGARVVVANLTATLGPGAAAAGAHP